MRVRTEVGQTAAEYAIEFSQLFHVFRIDRSAFDGAAFDPGAGEKTGYSNYSYWGSTFRAFLHNKTAVVMLALLVVLVAFTLIQPLLPGQYEANTVNNNPLTGIQLQNQAPSTTTVYLTVPEGTRLIGQKLNDDWYAVSNVSSTIKKRQKFTGARSSTAIRRATSKTISKPA